MTRRLFALALGLGAALCSHAYCVRNDLRDRSVVVSQDHHPDPLRYDRRLSVTLKPGQAACCKFHDLDCNPGGRQDSLVELAVIIAGATRGRPQRGQDPDEYGCGYPEGTEPFVKVTGGGTVRIVPNPRRGSLPYAVRVRTHDRQDLTGPKGLPCLPLKTKGK
jgi:hypothetical protein